MSKKSHKGNVRFNGFRQNLPEGFEELDIESEKAANARRHENRFKKKERSKREDYEW